MKFVECYLSINKKEMKENNNMNNFNEIKAKYEDLMMLADLVESSGASEEMVAELKERVFTCMVMEWLECLGKNMG